MKKWTVFTIVSLVVLFSLEAIARQNDGFWSGGGLVGWTSLAELGPLNDLLSLNGFAPLSEGFAVYGGWGSMGGSLGWRVGGRGASGETVSRLGDKTARLALSYGGLHFDYGLLLNERYDLSVGVTLGGGDASLTLFFHTPSTFADAVVSPSTTVLTREFFLAQPNLSVGFNVWIFYVRLNGAYLLTVPGDWRQQNGVFPGPPPSFNGWGLDLAFSFGWGYPDPTPDDNGDGPENE